MKKVVLLQEAGFLWDLYFIFYLRFNDQIFSEKSSAYNQVKKYTEFYKEIQLRFGDVSEDLSVFFRASRLSKHTFVYDCFLEKYEKDFIDKYNVEYFQQELADYNRVIQKMISFFFKGIAQHELEECVHSKEILFDYIKASDYSGEEKIKLYEFFMSPTRYITLLRRTLTAKQSLLSDYYKEHYKDIIDAHDLAVLDLLSEKMENNNTLHSNRERYVSYCLLDRSCCHLIFSERADLYVLGDQYKYTLENPQDSPQLCLEKFCGALCEKNRVDILEFLYDRGEATCKDLGRAFEFSASTAYHHISIMSRAGLIKTRTKGKIIFYSIDKKFLNDVIELLRKYNH